MNQMEEIQVLKALVAQKDEALKEIISLDYEKGVEMRAEIHDVAVLALALTESSCAGMVKDERFNEQQLIEHIQEPVLNELKRTQRALCYLINKAGGEVRIAEHETLKETPVSKWSVYLDNDTCEIVLRTKA